MYIVLYSYCSTPYIMMCDVVWCTLVVLRHMYHHAGTLAGVVTCIHLLVSVIYYHVLQTVFVDNMTIYMCNFLFLL
jgi:hypothetical protein